MLLFKENVGEKLQVEIDRIYLKKSDNCKEMMQNVIETSRKQGSGEITKSN